MYPQPHRPAVRIPALQQLVCPLSGARDSVRAVLLDQQVGGAPDVAVVH
jgi:hypothetical protein